MEVSADYSDDPEIEDAASLWRRLHPTWVVRDENRGGFRVSSAAFDDSQDGSPMSVYIEKILRQIQKAPVDILAGYDNYSLCSFTAGIARGLEQKVASLPKIDNNPGHGWVVGKKTRSVKRELARASQWMVLRPP